MTYDPSKHHRRSIRLKDYDYGQPGAYFVTICTHRHVCLFGDVMDGTMCLNGYGRLVEEEWVQTEAIRPNVIMDVFQVMPNHVHGIIGIVDPECGRGMARPAPTARQFGKPIQNSLSMIVGSFKSAVTKGINRRRGTPGTLLWQRGYYEHIIRHERALDGIRQYIVEIRYAGISTKTSRKPGTNTAPASGTV